MSKWTHNYKTILYEQTHKREWSFVTAFATLEVLWENDIDDIDDIENCTDLLLQFTDGYFWIEFGKISDVKIA